MVISSNYWFNLISFPIEYHHVIKFSPDGWINLQCQQQMNTWLISHVTWLISYVLDDDLVNFTSYLVNFTGFLTDFNKLLNYEFPQDHVLLVKFCIYSVFNFTT